MKKLVGLLLALLLIGLVAGSASALTFNDTKNFGDIAVYDTPNTIPPGSPGYNFAYTYTHNVTFNPAAASVDSAFLDITTKSNSANSTELWFVYEQGILSDSTNNVYVSLGWFGGYWTDGWVTDTFDLSDLIAGVSGNSWSIAFHLDEDTPDEWYGSEKIYLRSSTLRGEYSPVPEPATMMLFGLGLLGLAGVSRKRK